MTSSDTALDTAADDFDVVEKELAAPISDAVTLIASLSAIEIEYRRRANVAAKILDGIQKAEREGLAPRLEDLYAARDLGGFMIEDGASSSPGAHDLARHHDQVWAVADELITLRTNDDRD